MSRRVPAPSGKAIYRVLPPGRQVMSPEQNALHQRARLQGAMVAAVAKHGYAGTTIKQLVSLAGVSRTTFYRHFADKEQCFLATYDLIATLATERISRAYREAGGWRERLDAGFKHFAEIVVVERDSSHLVLVDALGAGHRVLERRDRMIGVFELMFRQSFNDAPRKALVTDTTIRAIVSGLRRVAYRRLLRGEPEKLGDVIEDLLNWAIGYHDPDVTPPVRPRLAIAEDAPRLYQALKESVIPPLDPIKARTTHTHRERILHAVASIASEGGFPALSIPAISARAGISNEAFYENFTDKLDAFLTVCREAGGNALTSAVKAFQAAPTWPEAVHDCIIALLRFIATDPVFARIAFFEILTGGPPAVEMAEGFLDSFGLLFAPGYQQHPEVPGVVSEAIVGGLWNILQYEIGHGRTAQLPELAPELVYITLAPFIGGREATRVATGGGE
jgi:AcrR family transcriptional regulator